MVYYNMQIDILNPQEVTMLVNRLSLLLTERQLAIKRVVADTHISRNTISNISNNPTANVSTATINRLCQY